MLNLLLRSFTDRIKDRRKNSKTDKPILEVLNPERQDATIDIVAIHGLARGFRSRTWEDKIGGRSLWLKDGLLRDVNDARVITFSYNPEALSLHLLVRKVLYRRAIDLVEELAKLRKETSTTRRPLVFISHSLGGLIVKRALIISNEATKAVAPQLDLRDVELSTAGVVFFGTPDTSLSSASLEETILNVAKLSKSYKPLQKEDDKSIRKDTKWLETEMEAFKPISARINILSFYEKNKTALTKSSFHSILIVNKEDSQRASNRGVPCDVTMKIQLPKRHSGLGGFNGDTDSAYITVLQSLKKEILPFAQDIAAEKWAQHDEAARLLTDKSLLSYLREDFAISSLIPDGPDVLVRENLDRRLHELFSSTGDMSKTKIVTIYGKAGAGKTTLARTYSLVAQRSRSFIFWLNAESRETMVTGFLQLAKAMIDYYWKKYASQHARSAQLNIESLRAELGLPDIEKMLSVKDAKLLEPIKVKVAIRGVQNWLLRKDNNWLLVYDNVDSPFDLLEFLPITLHGHILLLTRDRNSCAWGKTEIEVPDWNGEEATRLLFELAANGGSWDEEKGNLESAKSGHRTDMEYVAQKITESCQFRPLAISCAASRIKERKLTLDEYWTSLPLSTLFAKDSVAVEENLCETILCISGMLALHAIPLELFLVRRGEKNCNRPRVTGIDRFEDPEAVHEALKLLLDQNVIQHVPEVGTIITSPQSYHAHQLLLMHNSTWTRIQDDRKAQGGRTQTHAFLACYLCVQLIMEHDDAEGFLPEIQSFGRLMLPHAQACYELSSLLEKSSLRDIPWQVLGNLCMTQGATHDAIGLFKLALEETTVNTIERTRITLSLVSLYHREGNLHESGKLLNGINIASIRSQAPLLEFSVQFERAAECAAEGDLEDACQVYNQLGKEHTGKMALKYEVVEAVHYQSQTLRAMGRLDEAQAFYRRTLAGYRMLLGPYNPITLEVAEELGYSQQLRGEFANAAATYQQCIDTKNIMLGTDHPSTAGSVARLATIMDFKADFDKADELYEGALRIMEESLGESDRLTVATLENLALSYRLRLPYLTGEIKKTQHAYRKSVMLYARVIEIKKNNRQLYSDEDLELSEARLARLKKESRVLSAEDEV